MRRDQSNQTQPVEVPLRTAAPSMALSVGLSAPLQASGSSNIPPPPPEAALSERGRTGQWVVASAMIDQIKAGDSWTLARIGAHDMSHGLKDGCVELHIPCSPSGIFVNVTYQRGQDTYSVEGYKVPRGSSDKVVAYELEGAYAEDLAGVVEKAYEQAMRAKTPTASPVDRRSGWIRTLVEGETVMVGRLDPARLLDPPTFEVSQIVNITKSGQISLEGGAVYGPDGIEKGNRRGYSGLIPMESMVLNTQSLDQVKARLLEVKVPSRPGPGATFQVGVAHLAPTPDGQISLTGPWEGWQVKIAGPHVPVMRCVPPGGDALYALVHGEVGQGSEHGDFGVPLEFLPVHTNIAPAPRG